MPLQFTITNAGREAIVNAANTGTNLVMITEIALGSAYAAATASRTSLTDEIKRIEAIGGGTVADDIIHVTGKDTSDDAYEVKELGLYTDAGALFALCAESTAFITKGAGTFAVIAADLKITGLPAGSVVVGDVTLANPPATETVKGVAEIATQTETNAGTDDERIVTPKKLAARTATETRTGLVELATNAETQAGADTVRAVTPAALASVTATETRKGLIEIATAAEARAGTDLERALVAAHLPILASEFFKLLYPVGEMLITQREGSPESWLGFGTWQRFGAGRTLVGYDATDSDFNALGKTGGAKTITLSVGEIPAHTHGINPPATGTSNAADHTHGYRDRFLKEHHEEWSDGISNPGNPAFTLGRIGRENNPPGTTGTGLLLSGTHGGIDNDNNIFIYLDTTSQPGGAHSHTVDIAEFSSAAAGGGGAHSNVQPYITVFMWKRIS